MVSRDSLVEAISWLVYKPVWLSAIVLLAAHFLGSYHSVFLIFFLIPVSGFLYQLIQDYHFKAAIKRFNILANENRCSTSEFESADFANQIIEKVFSEYPKSIESLVLTILQNILPMVTPSFINDIKITKFELGKRAPSIGNIKVYEEKDPQTLKMDLLIDYDSDFKVSFVIKMMHIQLPVKISHFHLRAMIRLKAELIPNEYPYISVLCLQFLERPYVDVKVNVLISQLPFISTICRSELPKLIGSKLHLNPDLTEVPGMGYWIKNLIIDELCLLGQFPRSLDIDIAGLLTGNSRPRNPEVPDLDEHQKFVGSAYAKLAGRAKKAEPEGLNENEEEQYLDDENKLQEERPGHVPDEEEEQEEEEEENDNEIVHR